MVRETTDMGAAMQRRNIGRWVLGATLGVVAGLGACAPRASQDGCHDDLDCARGEVCEAATDECIASGVDVTAAENPAPASFTNQVIAFHRGELCLPLEVESGAQMPVLMRPCLHPCLAVSSFEFSHTFECLGSRCDALALMWMSASSVPEGCPPDAFAQFDPALCQYDTQVEFPLTTETSNGPIHGTMRLEIPFLTNADAAILASNPGDDVVEELVRQYPEADNRLPNGSSISILTEHPAPPPSCLDGACPCYLIGF
jgi:hypothetical protein